MDRWTAGKGGIKRERSRGEEKDGESERKRWIDGGRAKDREAY